MTRRPGRPPKLPADKASARVELLMTPAQLADLDRKRGDRSRAAYVLALVGGAR